MKKLLLTIGSAAAVVAPVATVVACDDSVSESPTQTGTASVIDGTLTIKGFVGPRIADESELYKLDEWLNTMGLELMRLENRELVTTVVLEGDITHDSAPNELQTVNLTVDFADTPFANLQDAYETFNAAYVEGDEWTASGTLFYFLVNGGQEDSGSGGGDTGGGDTGGGDTETTPTVVTDAMTAIEALTVTSDLSEIESNSITTGAHAIAADNTIASLGLTAAEVTKVTDILGTELAIEEVSWDPNNPPTIDVSFTVVGDTDGKVWEASIGTIVWRTATAEEIAAEAIKTAIQSGSISPSPQQSQPSASLGMWTTKTDLEDNLFINEQTYNHIIAAIEDDGAGGDSGFEFRHAEHSIDRDNELNRPGVGIITIRYINASTQTQYEAEMEIYFDA